MENITLGQVAVALAFLVGLVGSILVILGYVKKISNKLLEPISNQLSKMDSDHLEKIKQLELTSIRTDLVNFINDVEHDVQKSQIQRMNAHELYDRYRQLGGNSYVHDHWEALVRAGKI